jgi:mono/diheme cytochrome c family protein
MTPGCAKAPQAPKRGESLSQIAQMACQSRGRNYMVCLYRYIVILIATATTTHAEGGDVPSGHRLAQIWCGACHQVGAEDPVKPTPSLTQLACLWPAPTLEKFMRSSHENMPNFMLTAAQIKDISAYVSSLRCK